MYLLFLFYFHTKEAIYEPKKGLILKYELFLKEVVYLNLLFNVLSSESTPSCLSMIKFSFLPELYLKDVRIFLIISAFPIFICYPFFILNAKIPLCVLW